MEYVQVANCQASNGVYMRIKTFIFIATSIIVLFLFLSILFICENSDHKCNETNCKICEEISICEKGLEDLVAITTIFIFLNYFPKALSKRLKLDNICQKDSLISLKIKLLN